MLKTIISKLMGKSNDKIENSNIICGCFNLTEQDLKNAVSNGAKTFEEVQQITKVSTGCGKCKGNNEKLVNNLILKKKIDENQVVCGCYNVKVQDMINAIKNGSRSFEEIQKVTKAGTGCGGCIESNKALVGQLLAKY
ncbi:MAG: domain protein (2Fe-2S)-binding domain protein [Bacillota bacterium]|nr:domain protein (2Fe-2S)-binding domain protein [Bacillota bacterium]